MKHLKTFKIFELHIDTYDSALDKLKSRGEVKRAIKFKNTYKEITGEELDQDWTDDDYRNIIAISKAMDINLSNTNVTIGDYKHYDNLKIYKFETNEETLEYAIGTDDEADKACEENAYGWYYSVGGFEGVSESDQTEYLDVEKLIHVLVDGDEDYFEEIIREDLKSYIEHYDQMKDTVDIINNSHDIEEITEAYTGLIGVIESEDIKNSIIIYNENDNGGEFISIKIDDSDIYFKVDNSEFESYIDNQVEINKQSLMEDRKNDIKDDPKYYMENYIGTEQQEYYFDEDAFAESLKEEFKGDRGSALSSYDHQEHYIDIDGETLYIYRTD